MLWVLWGSSIKNLIDESVDQFMIYLSEETTKTRSVQVISVPDGIYALGKAHMRSTPQDVELRKQVSWSQGLS